MWNPMTRARNFVTRLRVMSDGVATLQQELNELQSSVAVLRQSTARISSDLDRVERTIDRSRSAANLAARRGTLNRSSLRVVFLAHNKDAWDSIGEVIQIMRERDDFDPIVVTVPHHYGGDTPPKGEGRMHKFLMRRGVPHLRLRKEQSLWAEELLRSLDPDVVFRQSQWDADVDPAFSAQNLGWTRLALIPYETMNPTHNVPWDYPSVDSAVDQHLHRAAWLVFCANDSALEIARAHSLTGGRQFRAVGHPKADALRRAEPEWPSPHESSSRRVLWSAHHSILSGWNDFGTFPEVKDAMLEWARAEPSLSFVFTHHPYLRGVLKQAASPVSREEFASWLDEWLSLPNTGYSRGAYAPLLAAADLLITDGPSMITESQILSTPTVFIEREHHVPFNKIGERIVEGVHRTPDIATAGKVSERILDQGDDLSEIQRRNVAELFGAPGAAQRIVDAIREEARSERGC